MARLLAHRFSPTVTISSDPGRNEKFQGSVWTVSPSGPLVYPALRVFLPGILPRLEEPPSDSGGEDEEVCRKGV